MSSLGFQWMQEDPVGFAQNDPEHFQLILAIMQGHIGGIGARSW